MSSPLAASTLGHMQSAAFAVPLLPGHTEANRIALASCRAGARKEASLLVGQNRMATSPRRGCVGRR